jgi:hypothetical protein
LNTPLNTLGNQGTQGASASIPDSVLQQFGLNRQQADQILGNALNPTGGAGSNPALTAPNAPRQNNDNTNSLPINTSPSTPRDDAPSTNTKGNDKTDSTKASSSSSDTSKDDEISQVTKLLETAVKAKDAKGIEMYSNRLKELGTDSKPTTTSSTAAPRSDNVTVVSTPPNSTSTTTTTTDTSAPEATNTNTATSGSSSTSTASTSGVDEATPSVDVVLNKPEKDLNNSDAKVLKKEVVRQRGVIKKKDERIAQLESENKALKSQLATKNKPSTKKK